MGIKVDPAELRRWEAAGPDPAAGPGHHHGDDDGPAWRFTLTARGLKLASRGNQREHWAKRHERDKAEVAAVTLAWSNAGPEGWHPPLPPRVTLTRVGGKAIDRDNPAGAFKATRGRVAGLVGVDDADDRVRRRVRRERGGTAAARVTPAAGEQQYLLPRGTTSGVYGTPREVRSEGERWAKVLQNKRFASVAWPEAMTCGVASGNRCSSP